MGAIRNSIPTEKGQGVRPVIAGRARPNCFPFSAAPATPMPVDAGNWLGTVHGITRPRGTRRFCTS